MKFYYLAASVLTGLVTASPIITHESVKSGSASLFPPTFGAKQASSGAPVAPEVIPSVLQMPQQQYAPAPYSGQTYAAPAPGPAPLSLRPAPQKQSFGSKLKGLTGLGLGQPSASGPLSFQSQKPAFGARRGSSLLPFGGLLAPKKPRLGLASKLPAVLGFGQTA